LGIIASDTVLSRALERRATRRAQAFACQHGLTADRARGRALLATGGGHGGVAGGALPVAGL
jgi:hypothetical protein